MKPIIVGSALIVILAGAGARAYYMMRNGTAPQVATSAVTRGDLVQVVSATGTVEAVTTVQVGSQVSGTVSWLGADFNSIVRKGQVIAKLDPSLLDAQVQQSRANLTKAQAGVDDARVQLADAEQKYARATQLTARQLLATSELDAARVRVDSGSADVRSAQAQVVQAQAALEQNQVGLAHTIITSPVGVLRVVNAALRFRPTSDTFAALNQTMPSGATPPSGAAQGGRLWAFTDGSLTPIAARLGITDGVNTELLDTSIEPGTVVVTAVTTTSSAASVNRPATANPLLGGRP